MVWNPRSGQPAPASVTATEIAAGAVSTPKLAAGAVDSTALAAGAVATSNLAAGAVDGAALAAGAVGTANLAAGAVDGAALAAGAVVAGKIGAGAVDGAALAAGAVVAGKIAADAVTAAEIAAASVTASELAAGAVTAGKIAAAAVDATAIAAGAVGTAQMGDAAVSLQKMVLKARRKPFASTEAAFSHTGTTHKRIERFKLGKGKRLRAKNILALIFGDLPGSTTSESGEFALWLNNDADWDPQTDLYVGTATPDAAVQFTGGNGEKLVEVLLPTTGLALDTKNILSVSMKASLASGTITTDARDYLLEEEDDANDV